MKVSAFKQTRSTLQNVADEHRQLRRELWQHTVDTVTGLLDPQRSMALAATAIVAHPGPRMPPQTVVSPNPGFNSVSVRLYAPAASETSSPFGNHVLTAPEVEAPTAAKETAAEALKRIKKQDTLDLQDVKTVMRGMWPVQGDLPRQVHLDGLRSISHASYWAQAALRCVSDDLSREALQALEDYEDDLLEPEDMAPKLWTDPAFILRMIEIYPQKAGAIPSEHIDLELAEYLNDAVPASLDYLREVDDPAVVDYLLKVRPQAVYESATLSQLERLWSDPASLMNVVAKHPMLLDVAPDAVLRDRVYLGKLALRNPDVLQFAADELRQDADWVAALMETSGVYFTYLHDEVRAAHPELWLQALEDYPLAIRSGTLDMLKAHPQAVKAALLRDERGFFHLNAPTQAQLLDVAAQVARSHHRAYSFLAFEVQPHPEVRIAGLSADPQRLAELPPSERDPAFLAKVGRLNPPVLRVLSEQERTQIFDVDPELGTEYGRWMDTLTKLDIEFPERFGPIERLQEVVQNRLHPREASDTRPIAIIIFPKTDHNHAFERFSTGILAPHFRQEYYEVGSESALYALLDRLAANGVNATLVEIGGHGTQRSLQLGKTSRTLSWDDAHLDVSDKDELGDRIDRILAEGGHLILKSCETGMGRAQQENLLNALMTPIDDAFGEAPVISTNNIIQLYRNGDYRNAGYFGGPNVPYQIKPHSGAVSRRLGGG